MSSDKKFIIYRSSAGSGKTYTLVKEYLTLALQYQNPSYYKKILAITFTNAAAAEMKERVIDKLKSFAKEDPDSEEMRLQIQESLGIQKEELISRASKVLEHLLHHYSDFSVSTIDSFIHGIIRSFSRELHLHPEFEIELDSEKVLRRAIDDMFGLVGTDTEMTNLMIEYVQSQVEDEKSWNVKESLLKTSKAILKEDAKLSIDKLKDLTSSDFKKIQKKLSEQIEGFENKIQTYGQAGLELIEKNGIDPSSFSSSWLPNYFIKLKDFIADKKSYKDYLPSPSIRAMGMGEKEFYGKSKPAAIKAQIDAIAEEMKAHLQEIFSLLEGEEAQWFNTRKLLKKSFFDNALIKRIYEAVEEWKKENDVLLISDFNEKINEIVRKNPAPFIYEKIGERFNHILIDEFQDTSTMQWQNFLPLIDNALSKGKFSMIVGDAKQAIYRWRNGDVNQFIHLPRIHNPLSEEIKQIETTLNLYYDNKNLEDNYRSAAEVVNFNNGLFEELKEIYPLDTLYKDHKQNIKSDKKGQVIVQGIFEKKAEDRLEITLEKIHQYIQENKAQGFANADQCILIRKKKHGSAIAKYLTDLGYDVVTSDSLLLKNNARVQLIVSWLQFLNNHENEKAKVTFLQSYSLLFEREKLSERIEKYTEKVAKKTRINLEQFLQDHNPELISPRLNTKTHYELCESISRIFEFHNTADQFIEKLFSVVFDFSEKKRKTLDQFLDFWDEQKDRISLDSTEGVDGIKIMTVHASKGLQFPCVIFPMIYSSGSIPKNIWLKDGDPEVGLPASVVKVFASKTTPYLPEIEIEFDQDAIDEINAVYVATTRAENKLILLIEGTKEGANNGLQTDILSSITNRYPDFDPNEEFVLGDPFKYATKDKLDSGELVDAFYSKEVFDELKISLQSSRVWDTEDTRTGDQQYGILVHSLLSQINTTEDVPELLKEIDSKTGLDEDTKSQLKKSIQDVFGLEHVKKWFDPSVKSKSEKTLVDREGKSHIPDRVVFYEDRVEIVDYKTGKALKKHGKQVKEYMDLLSKLESRPIKGYLLYTQELSIEEVQ